ncbi:MAG: hypothetical protein ACRDZN_04000, partial [Acidimicrobiales bacterium]
WWFDEVDADGDPTQISVGGAWGAIPWINLTDNYAAFHLTFDNLANSTPVWESVVPLIHSALTGDTPTGDCA